MKRDMTTDEVAQHQRMTGAEAVGIMAAWASADPVLFTDLPKRYRDECAKIAAQWDERTVDAPEVIDVTPERAHDPE